MPFSLDRGNGSISDAGSYLRLIDCVSLNSRLESDEAEEEETPRVEKYNKCSWNAFSAEILYLCGIRYLHNRSTAVMGASLQCAGDMRARRGGGPCAQLDPPNPNPQTLEQ
jgi:hypothetical protein